MEEYLDIVDENNTPTGKKCLRSEIHTKGLWHRTVHIYLFKMTDDIEFLVHLRAKTKDLNPDKWDTRFGGHLKTGKNIKNAIKEELIEEIGLKLEPSELIQGKIYKHDKYPNREFSTVYYYNFKDDISNLKFNDGEVQKVKWLKSSEILASMPKEPEIWSSRRNGFIEILKVLKSNLKK